MGLQNCIFVDLQRTHCVTNFHAPLLMDSWLTFGAKKGSSIDTPPSQFLIQVFVCLGPIGSRWGASWATCPPCPPSQPFKRVQGGGDGGAAAAASAAVRRLQAQRGGGGCKRSWAAAASAAGTAVAGGAIAATARQNVSKSILYYNISINVFTIKSCSVVTGPVVCGSVVCGSVVLWFCRLVGWW